ncbi:MAG: Hsp20 family protein [Bacteroidetes bacterium]|jgi:HSP20 family molecular chaperone IbpA|nr:Hsp20/alpha crystallin family protein [Phycisphaerae bacterium]NBB73827.1 Hsp20 family protein [Bacteroidota bacterium]
MAENKGQEIQKQETQLQQGTEPTREGRLFMPPTDIRETNDSIVLTADMPGVKPDGVDVTLEKDVLTVCGAVADEHLGNHNGDGYAEYEVGNYQRSFALSDEIDRDKIDARMDNGVLTLTLPKTTPSQKRIEVKAG